MPRCEAIQEMLDCVRWNQKTEMRIKLNPGTCDENVSPTTVEFLLYMYLTCFLHSKQTVFTSAATFLCG